MNREDIIAKITSKKEFSQLPEKDVELVFKKFDKEHYVDSEKIKFTRDLLRKVFSVFTSRKLLKMRDYDSDWILKKHISTKERFKYYEELYELLLRGIKGKINILDFGAGVNGFSYKYFNKKIYYLGVEAIGQLVDLMNRFFDKEGLKEFARAEHLSLFELEKIKKIILESKGKKIIFLFKTLDSLEMLERDYSKKLLREIVPVSDRVIVSFATRSLIKRKRFKVNRNWIMNFIKENFRILDDFEMGDERYVVFCSKVYNV